MSEAIRLMVMRACQRADVSLDAFSFENGILQITVSCERGVHSFGASGITDASANETLEQLIFNSVVDWSGARS